jgi:cytochrome P450
MGSAAASVTLQELERDPHPVLARLRREQPVARVPALGGWLVTERALVLQAMRDPATFTVDDPRFTTARILGASMLSLDGPEHDRHRRAFAAVFRLDAVRSRLASIVAEECDRLLDALEPAGGGDLRRGLAGPLAVSAVAQAIGLDDAEPSRVLGWYAAIVEGVSRLTAGKPAGHEAAAAFAELREAVHAAVGTGGPGSPLVAAAQELAPDELAANVAVILFGGIDTTEGAIANLLLHLLSSADQLSLVRADRTLVPAAIEESLRLEPAAAVVDRYATRDVELGGATIREGDLVTLSLAAANRDPTVFPDPDRFDVQRADLRLQVAFAHGPHVCLGMHLARLEARVALVRVLERFPSLRLDPQRPSAPHGLVFRKPPALHALWMRERRIPGRGAPT